jgi:hypothetical protein
VSAAILEMLVFPNPGLIKLLPAFTKRWTKGKGKDLCFRGEKKIPSIGTFAKNIDDCES